MDKWFNRLLIAAFLIIIFGGAALTLTGEGNDRLFYENRMAVKPVPLTKETYFSGEFFTKGEKGLSDNITNREEILTLYTKINHSLLRRQEVNRVVYGKDGYLLPYYATNTFNRQQVDKDIDLMVENLGALNSLVEENGGRLIFAAIPAQFSLYNNKYPKGFCTFAPKLDYVQARFLPRVEAEGVTVLDFKQIFAQWQDLEQLYFKTDHHFNIYGALACYQSIMAEVNKTAALQVLDKDSLTFTTAPNRFLGSMNRKIYNTYKGEDSFVYALPKVPIGFDRYDNGNRVQSLTIKLPEADSFVDYESFIGGDVGELIIDTNRPQLPTLLIIGDSYTNALETLFYYSFDKTYSLDFRYNKTKAAAEYIKAIKPDYVLYVRDDTIYLSAENNGSFFEIKED